MTTELEKAAAAIVKMYIANKGKPNWEFISCITPKHAGDLSPNERRKSAVWAAWDRLRLALGEDVIFAESPEDRAARKLAEDRMREFQATAS